MDYKDKSPAEGIVEILKRSKRTKTDEEIKHENRVDAMKMLGISHILPEKPTKEENDLIDFMIFRTGLEIPDNELDEIFRKEQEKHDKEIKDFMASYKLRHPRNGDKTCQ